MGKQNEQQSEEWNGGDVDSAAHNPQLCRGRTESDGRCSLVKSCVCFPDSFPEGLAGILDEWETGVHNISSLLEGLGVPLFVWMIKQWDPASSEPVIELQKGRIS